MKVTITSDGSAFNTKATTEDGSEIKGMASIDIHIGGGTSIPTARIEIFAPALNVTAETDFFICDPRTSDVRKVSRIVFADGTPDWVPVPAEEKARADG